MFLVIGTKYRVSGSEQTPEKIRCSRCGTVANFIEKSGRNYLTLFFVLPIFPVGKTNEFIECPNCHARYNV
jgi:DNA-directed RNA polymerase subunit RPC12/RpoP